MNFGFERSLNKFQNPLNKISLNVCIDKILFNRTFLQNSKTEPLSYITILLFFQNFNNSFNYNIVSIICNVLNSFNCGDDD